MKIQSLNYYNKNSFSARNKDIRTADKIQRKARQSFPMVSSSYIQDYWPIADSKRNDETYDKTKVILQNIIQKIRRMRDVCQNPDKYDISVPIYELYTPYAFNLRNIKNAKAGNCMESAIATLGVLAANGYYDSKRMNLFLDTSFINKKTGEVEYKKRNDMDHSMVLTTMNRKCKKQDDYIVIDSWMGFADSYSGAIAKYKQNYKQEYIDECIRYNKALFTIEQHQKNKNFNLNNYKLKTNFVLQEADFINSNGIKMLGEYSSVMFDNLEI